MSRVGVSFGQAKFRDFFMNGRCGRQMGFDDWHDSLLESKP